MAIPTASDNVFPKLIESMNTSDPAAPSDSSWKVYAKAGGIYARSSNAVVGPFVAASAVSTTVVGCTATRTTDQTGVLDSTTTLVVFNGTDEFDSDAFHDPAGANPGRLIIPSGKDGYYVASAFVIWDTNNTGGRRLAIVKNGTTNMAIQTSHPDTGGNFPYTNVTTPPVFLAATDYLILNAYQTSGGTRTISGATVPIRFGLVRVGT